MINNDHTVWPPPHFYEVTASANAKYIVTIPRYEPLKDERFTEMMDHFIVDLLWVWDNWEEAGEYFYLPDEDWWGGVVTFVEKDLEAWT